MKIGEIGDDEIYAGGKGLAERPLEEADPDLTRCFWRFDSRHLTPQKKYPLHRSEDWESVSLK